MQNWLLQSLSDILNRESELELNSAVVNTDFAVANGQSVPNYYGQEYPLAELKAQGEWRGAIAAVEKLLLSQIDLEDQSSLKKGLIVSAPVPILSNLSLIAQFQTGVFTPEAFNCMALMPCPQSTPKLEDSLSDINPVIKLPLLPKDPINQEQFCLIFTADFALTMVLGKDINNIPKFQFSFAPNTIDAVRATLRSR